jgi:uncharacterized membrane protein YraQ (UPF0718 family)
MPITKTRVAKEWLLFLGCVVAGFLVAVSIGLVFPTLNDAQTITIWSLLYPVVLLFRSIVWAVKTLKAKGHTHERE